VELLKARLDRDCCSDVEARKLSRLAWEVLARKLGKLCQERASAWTLVFSTRFVVRRRTSTSSISSTVGNG
jgi:hypothetical protein